MNWFSKKVYEQLVKTRHINISPHFKLYEIDCRDGAPVPFFCLKKYALKLIPHLETIRALYNEPMIVNSWYRTERYNTLVGGVKTSWHKKAAACDFWFVNHSSNEVYNDILKLINEGKIPNGGLGLYDGFVHYDTEDTGERWDKRKNKEIA
ncbi:MAG: hypothetical protein COV43_04395 [Deltaproteobacteria bacterium CG11_big_fil_rev_8_21_14_0_20_42_23]|nr:MAG: hypothetical protein COV43_04395 [Deltaproteobacteria bacterium CG11_big_fil_rev_8_21_14_0_20_42_23]PJC65014.1 MAG: hypothetical protein CO021_00785 [Deltaproteobacteria bacterium CG_4_9_14_0_2_um_filter_42_21]